MTIEERIAGKNSDEIDAVIVEIEKELLLIGDGFGAKRKQIHELDLKINEIESEKKRLRIDLDDIRMKLNRAEIELAIAKSAFWKARV